MSPQRLAHEVAWLGEAKVWTAAAEAAEIAGRDGSSAPGHQRAANACRGALTRRGREQTVSAIAEP